MTNSRSLDALTRILTLGSLLLSSACGSSASPNAAAGSSGSGGKSSGESGGGSNAEDGAGDSSTSAAGEAGEAPESCAKSALNILFSPMYSAYDGMHTFQVPAVIDGLDPSQVTIDWSASDPTMVKLESDPTTGGVMITTQKAGKVSIIARAGDLCGSSLLTITSATPEDWTDGSKRYNDGVVINRLPRTGGGGKGMGGAGGAAGAPAGGGASGAGGASAQDAACTNCHGDTAAGPYKTVQHTPEQTGGFSDADLIDIFQKGVVPTGGYFDATITSYMAWQSFHKWNVGDTPQNMVVYLRSLTPAAQTGVANFGGRLGGGGANGHGGPGGGGAAGHGGHGSGGTATGGSGGTGAVSGGTGGTDTGGSGGA